MKAFCSTFLLLCKKEYKTFLGLLAASLAALLLCAGLAGVSTSLMGGSGFGGLTLAVADEDPSGQSTAVLRYLASTPGVREYTSLTFTDTQTALHMVEEGSAAAALILPEGLLASVMSGENLSPRIILNPNRPLESFAVSIVAQSALSMLASAQQGIGLTTQAYGQYGGDMAAVRGVLQAANLQYGYWALGRGSLFNTRQVSATGALPVSLHYLTCSAAFFALLCVCVLQKPLSISGHKAWYRRLRAAGVNRGTLPAAQLLFAFSASLLLLFLLTAGLAASGMVQGQRIQITATLLPGLLCGALFIAGFAFLCANVGGLLPCAGLSFVLGAGWLYTAGGILPPVLLGNTAAALGTFSPVSWLQSVFLPLYRQPFNPNALWLLALTGCMCAIGGILLGRKQTT